MMRLHVLKSIVLSIGLFILVSLHTVFGSDVDYSTQLKEIPEHRAITFRLVSMGNDIDSYIASLDPKDSKLRETRLTWLVPALAWKESNLGIKPVNTKGIGYGLFTTRYDSIAWVFKESLGVKLEDDLEKIYPHDQFVKDITNNHIDDISMAYVLLTNIARECYDRYKSNRLINKTINKCIIALYRAGLQAELGKNVDEAYYTDIVSRAMAIQTYYKAEREAPLDSTKWIKEGLPKYTTMCGETCIQKAIDTKYKEHIFSLPELER